MIAALNAHAYADAYLTVQNEGGLCLSADTISAPVCDNSTALQLDARSDHTLYILPSSGISSGDSVTDKLSYILMTPIILAFLRK